LAPTFTAVIGLVSLRHRHFNLTKQRHDLLRAEPLLRHDQSSFPSSFSHNAWSKKARSGQVLYTDGVKINCHKSNRIKMIMVVSKMPPNE
jgi:hypothetical protein